MTNPAIAAHPRPMVPPASRRRRRRWRPRAAWRRIAWRPARIWLMAVGVASLAACELQEPAAVAPDPEPTPDLRPAVVATAPIKRPTADPASETSKALTLRYAQVENELVSQGLLRTDRGGADTPFDAGTLTENFVRIALFNEYSTVSGQLIARESASRLRRWDSPVTVDLIFGRSVAPEQRAKDRATVATLVDELARATGHQITGPVADGNLTMFVVDEDERRDLAAQLQQAVPGISDAVTMAVTNMPPSTFCLVIAFSTEDAPFTYRRAFGVVRAEHPPLLRKSCFHEEIAQAMGLANDSPAARPSIFNDDEEFALLTDHDVLLLTMLYDARLEPGMSAAEVLPIVRSMAGTLRPGLSQDDFSLEMPVDATASAADTDDPAVPAPLESEAETAQETAAVTDADEAG